MGNILRDQMFYRSKQLSASINQKRKDHFYKNGTLVSTPLLNETNKKKTT